MSLTIKKTDGLDIAYQKSDGSIEALECELRKGLQSYKDGKLLTIDEAWADIDSV